MLEALLCCVLLQKGTKKTKKKDCVSLKKTFKAAAAKRRFIYCSSHVRLDFESVLSFPVDVTVSLAGVRLRHKCTFLVTHRGCFDVLRQWF